MGRGKGSLKARRNSFALDFYYQGQRIRATLPLSPTKKAHWVTAENMLAAIQHDIALGSFNLAKYFPNHPKAHQFRTATEIRISDQLNSWLKYKQDHLELSTLRDYRSAVDCYLIPSFGDLTLDELTSSHVRNWLHSLDISNQRKNNILIPLRAIFSDAYADELISRNPLDRIKQAPRRTPEADPFTRGEMESILAACEGQIRNIFKFAFWTGLRTSELIALQWSHVNFRHKTIFVRRVRTRTGEKDRPKTSSSIRPVELLPPAVDALRSQQKQVPEDGPIFLNPRTGKPWLHDGPLRKTAWTHALRKAGVRYRKTYNTRHTFASIMLSSGVNPMWVAKQMGHKDWGMIRKVYGRWIPDVDPAIADKISFLWSQDGHRESING